LAFDRTRLADEMIATALDEARARFNRWLSDWVTPGLRGDRSATPDVRLRRALDAVGSLADERSGVFRTLLLSVILRQGSVSTPGQDGPAEVLRWFGMRLVQAYADAVQAPPPEAGLAGELGSMLIIEAFAAHLFHDAADQARAFEHCSRLLDAALGRDAPVTEGRSDHHASPERESADEVVSRIDRSLDTVDLHSAEAVSLLEELASVLPTSSWAFARGRAILERVLSIPDLRRSEAGQHAWSIAAEVVGMAAGHRELAEEAARVRAHRRIARHRREELLASIRGSWLLLRLEWFEQARAELEQVRQVARRGGLDDVGCLAEAFLGYAASFDGPLADAVEHAEGVAMLSQEGPDALFAAPLAAAAAGRALLLTGDVAGAARWLQAPIYAGVPRSLGQTMLELSRSWMLLATQQNTEALRLLVALRQRLERLHVTNPAGWPWLEPTTIALVRLGLSDQATRLISDASPQATRWGTPLVIAEVHRARATVAPTQRERHQHLALALRALEAAPGAIELERTRMMVRAGAQARGAHGVHTGSVLVQALTDANPGEHRMTPRVHAVALLVAEGRRNKEIADALHLTQATVRQHVSAAMRATGTRTRTELALLMTSPQRPPSSA
jgi:DNA-binding CsgD family transcriptional regulator